MGKGRKNTQLTGVIIWSGVILGILDWITDAIYAANCDFASAGLHAACVIFLVLQPLSYLVIFIKFVSSREEIKDPSEKREKMCFSFLYAFLQQCKLMGSFDNFNNSIAEKFEGQEQIKAEFVNLENSYRVQIIDELFLQTLPQLIIQASNNSTGGWNAIAAISFAVSVLVALKDISQLAVFAVKKYGMKQEVNLRPENYITLHQLDEASMKSMQKYLTDSESRQLGQDGNTALHALAKQSEEIQKLEEAASLNPHQLFMLNKHGQTPLDICMEHDSVNNLDITQEDSAMSQRNEGQDLERGKAKNVARANPPKLYLSRSKTTKVIDESQTLGLVGVENPAKAEQKAAAEAKYSDWMCKTWMLMAKMSTYHPNCSIKFLYQPNRLDLKFERSFAMAVKKSRADVIARFPKRTIKTVYVSMSQLKDIRQFKAEKRSFDQEIITTPLHLACQTSNVEAARILLTDHDFDVNILLYERSFLCELLTTGGYQDFAILSNVFKKRKPCVNSGSKMPLNQAILRGNQYIIQTLLSHGNPNPFARDENGITPIHVACAKLDWDTIMELVRLGGDPEIPDRNGNTFLHLLCEGGIKDSEYDFAKMACQQFSIKLTRNNEGKSPLNLLRSMDATVANARGQPNYKGRLQDYLESILATDPTLEDHASNNELHLAIIRDDMDKFTKLVETEAFEKCLLNLRNSDGKSPLFLTIEHSRQQMFDTLFSKFESSIDFRSKDTLHGNTALHMACLQEHVSIVEKIYGHEPKLCMQPNFLGRSPFFLACQKGNQALLDIFEEQKTEAIIVQDCLGENMLFMCARESKVSIFNWFQGSNNFFRARGQQNYKGQSIEHVVCMEGKTNIVQDIKPKLDTKDYYGNLPIHYTIANDDHQMVLNYFTKGKVYFELRNFKYETIFHIAAKNNSLRSLQALVHKTVFVEELVKRDFKGDTPLHAAAKAGSIDILEFFLTASTPAFLEIENDFGLTPAQALSEKIAILEDKSLDKECSPEEKDKCLTKIEKLLDTQKFLDTFEAFMDADSWAERFDVEMELYLELAEDPNLRIFLGQDPSYN